MNLNLYIDPKEKVKIIVRKGSISDGKVLFDFWGKPRRKVLLRLFSLATWSIV